MTRILLLLTLAACSFGVDGADEDKSSDDEAGDDTAADTSADTDTDTTPDLATYEAFVAAHAEAYCASLDACGFLDAQGYADVAACETAVTELFFRVACESYQPAAAANCLEADAAISADCANSREGAPPLVCRDVCAAAGP